MEGESVTVVEEQEQATAREVERESAAPHARWRASLAPVERELLALLACGHKEAQIAEALALSLRSVERHVIALAHSLGVRDRAALAAYARYAGLDQPHDS